MGHIDCKPFNAKEYMCAREEHSKETKYEGGMCKKHILGQHKWIVSFDINSLYHILLYNIIYR